MPPGQDALAEALGLLKRFNRLEEPGRGRLSSAVLYRGFEPWWFHQDDLLLRFLYPYCRQRAQFDRALTGRLDFAGAGAGVREVLCRLGFWRDSNRRSPAPGSRLGRRLSDAGLILLSLIALLVGRLRGRDTAFVVLDSVSPGETVDFRFRGIYRELRARSYRWLEYVHARADYRSTWRNLRRRRRLVVFPGLLAKYLSRLPGGPPTPGPRPTPRRRPAGVDDPESRFLDLLADWHLRRCAAAAAEIEVQRRILRFQRVRQALAPDDERHVFPLVVACKLERIPVACFQHGLLNSFHAGLMAYGFRGERSHGPDLMFAWSEYFRGRLTAGDLFDEESCRASGPIRPPEPDALATARRARSEDPAKITVLLVSELASPFVEVVEYLRALDSDPEIEPVIRLRPGEDGARWQASMGDGERRLSFDESATVLEAVGRADVVLGCYSSVLYEAIRAFRPVVALGTSYSYGIELVQDGLAEPCSRARDVCEAVRRAARIDRRVLADRSDRIWGPEVRDGAEEIFEVAERELWGVGAGPAILG